MGYPGDGRDGIGPDELDDMMAEEREAQLSLADPDERLPWLESADEDEAEGADTGRIVAFALIGLVAVAALVGLLWWLTRDRPDPAMVADGSVIEAPKTPYKERPTDAGGTEVAGTGDTSFAVAEGRQVEGRIAGEGAPAATPAARPQASGSASSAATAAPATGGVGVQVGAYSSKAAAEAGWQQLSGRLAPLQGRSHRVIEGTADSGTIFRLQAVAGNVAEAETLCRSLRAAGGDCQVKR